MNRASQGQAYRGSEVLSASPGRLLIITYDGLLAAMTRLRMAYSMNNAELATSSLDTARGLLGELLATLNHEQGGEIAKNLSGLYVFVLSELHTIASSRDTARLERNAALIREIRDAFAAVAIAPARAAS